MSTFPSEPIVSVLIANHNQARFLGGAIQSALKQSLSSIEVIVVDDASTDDSVRVAQNYAAQDSRVRVVELRTNAGPAGARNAGLDVARGTWVAILDSDDFMHPERLDVLVEAAKSAEAEICADDLLVFGEGRRPKGHLSKFRRQQPFISLADFLNSNLIYGSEPTTGNLKPLIKRSFLRHHKIAYDRVLKIGEDFDLIARALAAGAKFRLVNRLGYFYRKHRNSISHRLSEIDLVQMLHGDDRLRDTLDHCPAELSAAFERRRSSIRRALEFDRLISAIKLKAWSKVGRIAVHHPDVLPMLLMPLSARIKRLKSSPPEPESPEKRACVISRQRIVGATNGSSAYILGICRGLHESGYELTLISPNKGTLGRWPFFRLSPETSVFSHFFLRGAWRVGSLCIAKDPRVAFAAAKAKFARAANRRGIDLSHWDQQAPYVIGSPWERDELLYVTRHAPNSQIVIADYAFTTPAIPFALSENAQSLVVMHDFLSARADRFQDARLADSVKTVDQASEIRLLRQADAVIAIQDVEARQVEKLIPDRPIILSPVACTAVVSAVAGSAKSVLFVGSNTAPNVIGLQWFLDTAWPRILARVPDCELIVAGGVGSRFPNGANQTRFCGIVDDLSPLYESAGVVISPLTIGSGLKVKVVEALGRGKAIVATSVSVEGIGADISSALDVRDDPELFGEAVSILLADDQLRERRAKDALRFFEANFSREACLQGLLGYLNTQVNQYPSSLSDAHRQVERIS